MERDHFIQATARTLGLSSEAVRESLKRVSAGVAKQPASDSGSKVRGTPVAPKRSPRQIREEQVLATIHAYPGTPLAKRLESEYSRITEALQLPLEVPSESALFIAEQAFGEDPEEVAADELLRAFEEAVIREAYQIAVADLRRAESSGDSGLVVQAQALCTKLSARLAQLGA
jgi:hypothetical protein